MLPIRVFLAGLLLAVTSASATPVKAQTVPAGQAASLGVAWWVWALTAPRDHDPVKDLTGADCAAQQPREAFFLAGTYLDGVAIHRTCTVPVGRAVFFPVVNVRALGQDAASCARTMTSSVNDMNAALTTVRVTLDGHPRPFVRGATGGGRACVMLQKGLWLGVDGYWSTVTFRDPGAHTLKFRGAFGGFTQNVTYTLHAR